MATETGPDLEAGRLAVESLMDDTCVITRLGPAGPIDPVTLKPIPGAVIPLYDGKCTLSVPGSLLAERTMGGQQQTVLSYAVKLPINEAPILKSADILTLTSSRRRSLSVGSKFIVDAQVDKTMAVSSIVMLTRKLVAGA
jgi:hypothetical protein